MATLPENKELCNCSQCGEPRHWYEQAKWNGGVILLAECRNDECPAYMVTLDEAQWQDMTEIEFARYAASMANVRRVQGAA